MIGDSEIVNHGPMDIGEKWNPMPFDSAKAAFENGASTEMPTTMQPAFSKSPIRSLNEHISSVQTPVNAVDRMPPTS